MRGEIELPEGRKVPYEILESHFQRLCILQVRFPLLYSDWYFHDKEEARSALSSKEFPEMVAAEYAKHMIEKEE